MSVKPNYKSAEELMLDLAKGDSTDAVTENESDSATNLDKPETNIEEPVDVNDKGSEGADNEDVVSNAPEDDVDNGIVDDWDLPEEGGGSEPTIVNTEVEAISRIVKDLNLDGISTLEELKSKISETLKPKEEVTDNQGLGDIPEVLREAISIAKDGGNFMDYLGIAAVDYESVDDYSLLAHNYAPHFTGPDGKVNEEKLSEYLEDLSDADIQIRASEMRNGYKTAQASRIADMKNLANTERYRNRENLKETINSTQEIAGFKLNLNHKNELFNEIASGNLMKNLFYTKDGKYDYKKIVDLAFKAKYFDKIKNHYQLVAKTSAKREMLTELGNPEVQRPGEKPNPNPTAKSGLDLYVEQLMQGKAR
jgi:hypothetical protein